MAGQPGKPLHCTSEIGDEMTCHRRTAGEAGHLLHFVDPHGCAKNIVRHGFALGLE